MRHAYLLSFLVILRLPLDCWNNSRKKVTSYPPAENSHTTISNKLFSLFASHHLSLPPVAKTHAYLSPSLKILGTFPQCRNHTSELLTSFLAAHNAHSRNNIKHVRQLASLRFFPLPTTIFAPAHLFLWNPLASS